MARGSVQSLKLVPKPYLSGRPSCLPAAESWYAAHLHQKFQQWAGSIWAASRNWKPVPLVSSPLCDKPYIVQSNTTCHYRATHLEINHNYQYMCRWHQIQAMSRCSPYRIPVHSNSVSITKREQKYHTDITVSINLVNRSYTAGV